MALNNKNHTKPLLHVVKISDAAFTEIQRHRLEQLVLGKKISAFEAVNDVILRNAPGKITPTA